MSVPRRIELQVLGSGGPMHGGGRGSAAYLIRQDGVARIAIDMGGDTPLALARAQVGADEIDTLLISHIHPDHVSGLPAFLWNARTGERRTALHIMGPPAGRNFPDLLAFWERLFGPEGAYPFLAAAHSPSAFSIDLTVLAGEGAMSRQAADFSIGAFRVHHGSAPTLAFRVEIGGVTIVFAGDQTMQDADFAFFASGADVMVAHLMANPDVHGTSLADSVAAPEDIGRIARLAEVRHLVLSHLMGAATLSENSLWSLDQLEASVANVQRECPARITVAEDMALYPVTVC